jgi:signal peptidase I
MLAFRRAEIHNPDMALIPRTASGRAFWLALAFAFLSLASAALSPVSGVVSAAAFLILAFGIRRGDAGPAILMGGFFLLRALAAVAGTSGEAMWIFLIMLPIPLGIAWFAFAAAWEARRYKRVGRLWPWLTALALFAIALVCFGAFQMPSGAMEPTVLAGDTFLTDTLTWRLGRVPQRGEVVVIRYPVDREQMFVKRVIGVPGDRLHLEHKQLYRNGSLVTEPFAVHTSPVEDRYRDNFPSDPVSALPAAQPMLQKVTNGEIVVPQGQYFVMGDNRDDSLDSRYWGFVPRDDIIASPLFIVDAYDPKQEGLRTVINTRWSRLFRPL